jgi:hypothetical protein
MIFFLVACLDALLVTDLVVGVNGLHVPVMSVLFVLVQGMNGFFQASRSRQRIKAI